MPRCFSISIQSEVAWRVALRAFTEPAIWIAPENSSSFSVSVVLPASGWEMMAKVRRRRTSVSRPAVSRKRWGRASRRPDYRRARRDLAHCLHAGVARHRGLRREPARPGCSGARAAPGAGAQPLPAAHRAAADRRAPRADASLGVERLGKRVVLALEGDLFLVIHLMIAGRLRWLAAGAKLPAQDRPGACSSSMPAASC